MEKINITAEEAQMIVDVLNDGMPATQSKKDKLAELCVKLEDELVWVNA